MTLFLQGKTGNLSKQNRQKQNKFEKDNLVRDVSRVDNIREGIISI
jgi:hypothetical protein